MDDIMETVTNMITDFHKIHNAHARKKLLRTLTTLDRNLTEQEKQFDDAVAKAVADDRKLRRSKETDASNTGQSHTTPALNSPPA